MTVGAPTEPATVFEQHKSSVNEHDLTAYKNDLEFLNKFDEEKVKKMSAPFKNAGRGNISRSHAEEYQGRWGVVVGMYYPKQNIVQKPVGKLNAKFSQPHDNQEQAKHKK